MKTSEMLNLLALMEKAQEEYYPANEVWFYADQSVLQLYDLISEDLE